MADNRWKLTGLDEEADEYVDGMTGEAYYHRYPELTCLICRIEPVGFGRIYCEKCAAQRRKK